VSLLQFRAGTRAKHSDLDVGVIAMLPLKGKPLPHRFASAASRELLDGIRTGPAIEDHEETQHFTSLTQR
jgi:hypothetical protein